MALSLKEQNKGKKRTDEDYIVAYQAEIPAGLWDQFVKTIPRPLTVNEGLIELLKSRIGTQ